VRRTIPPVLAILLVATALAGCSSPAPEPTSAASSSPPTTAPVADDCVAVGEGTGEIDLLVVQGGFGDDFMVADISSVYADITETQRSVRIPGDDGPVAQPGSTVTADYAIFDGTTGAEVVTTFGGQPEAFVLDAAELPVGILKVLSCATPNTRLAGIIPASEGFATPPAGFPTGVPLIFVADVRSVTD